MSAPGDLAGLGDCKAWLGLTSTADDALLSGLIAAVSRAIGADLGRTVLPATVTEVLDGGGEVSLALRQWPVTRVAACTIDGVAREASPGPGVRGYVLDPADPAPPGAAQWLSLRGGTFPPGIGNVAVTYRAGYEVIGESATVPAAAPFAVQAAAPYGAWASDGGVDGLPPGTGYAATAGTYTFAASAAGATVALSYAYVPADLAQACVEWVADRYVARGRVGQSAKTLGGQETTSFIVKAMPDAVSRLLQPYRRVAR